MSGYSSSLVSCYAVIGSFVSLIGGVTWVVKTVVKTVVENLAQTLAEARAGVRAERAVELDCQRKLTGFASLPRI